MTAKRESQSETRAQMKKMRQRVFNILLLQIVLLFLNFSSSSKLFTAVTFFKLLSCVLASLYEGLSVRRSVEIELKRHGITVKV